MMSGMTDMPPASQIKLFERNERSSGQANAQSNSKKISARPRLKNKVSINNPFIEFKGVAFFKHVYDPHVVAITM